MTKSISTDATAVQEVVITRVFAAPIETVWKAITTKEDLNQWFFEIKEFKPEVGFEFEFTGENEGTKYFHRCKIIEAIPNKKLAYSWRYNGYEGDSLVTFQLSAEGNRTKLQLTHEGLESFPKLPDFAKANFLAGWTSLIGSSLKEFVEKKAGTNVEPLIITRVFDAPRAVVFKMWTDPKHLAEWWGPHGFTNPLCELDLRPGGPIRIDMRGPDGTVYPMTGTFQEIVEPERLVFTAQALDQSGAAALEVLNRVTFAEKNDKTTLTLEARVTRVTAEGIGYAEGMKAGWTQSLERLTTCVEKETK